MPSELYLRRLSESMRRGRRAAAETPVYGFGPEELSESASSYAGPRTGAPVYEFDLPEELAPAGSTPGRPREPEPPRRPPPVSRRERFFTAMAMGSPRAAIEYLDRKTQRFVEQEERRYEQRLGGYERATAAWEKEIAKGEEEERRRKESMFRFGRELYKKEGDPSALHPEDPARREMTLRGRLRAQPGETYKGPYGERWYVGPEGKWRVHREPPQERQPGDYKLGGDALAMTRRREQIRQEVLEQEAEERAAAEMEKGFMAESATKGAADPLMLSEQRRRREVAGAKRERLLAESQLIEGRLAEIEGLRSRKAGSGAQTLSESLRPEGGRRPTYPAPRAEREGYEEPDPNEAPLPFADETSREYFDRLVAMGYSEGDADELVAAAQDSGLLEEEE